MKRLLIRGIWQTCREQLPALVLLLIVQVIVVLVAYVQAADPFGPPPTSESTKLLSQATAIAICILGLLVSASLVASERETRQLEELRFLLASPARFIASRLMGLVVLSFILFVTATVGYLVLIAAIPTTYTWSDWAWMSQLFVGDSLLTLVEFVGWGLIASSMTRSVIKAAVGGALLTLIATFVPQVTALLLERITGAPELITLVLRITLASAALASGLRLAAISLTVPGARSTERMASSRSNVLSINSSNTRHEATSLSGLKRWTLPVSKWIDSRLLVALIWSELRFRSWRLGWVFGASLMLLISPAFSPLFNPFYCVYLPSLSIIAVILGGSSYRMEAEGEGAKHVEQLLLPTSRFARGREVFTLMIWLAFVLCWILCGNLYWAQAMRIEVASEPVIGTGIVLREAILFQLLAIVTSTILLVVAQGISAERRSSLLHWLVITWLPVPAWAVLHLMLNRDVLTDHLAVWAWTLLLLVAAWGVATRVTTRLIGLQRRRLLRVGLSALLFMLPVATAAAQYRAWYTRIGEVPHSFEPQVDQERALPTMNQIVGAKDQLYVQVIDRWTELSGTTLSENETQEILKLLVAPLVNLARH